MSINSRTAETPGDYRTFTLIESIFTQAAISYLEIIGWFDLAWCVIHRSSVREHLALAKTSLSSSWLVLWWCPVLIEEANTEDHTVCRARQRESVVPWPIRWWTNVSMGWHMAWSQQHSKHQTQNTSHHKYPIDRSRRASQEKTARNGQTPHAKAKVVSK